MAWAIGASQPDDWAIGASQPTAPAPSGGQVISIIMSKLLFPAFWLKQGENNRRDFLKNSFLSVIGIK